MYDSYLSFFFWSPLLDPKFLKKISKFYYIRLWVYYPLGEPHTFTSFLWYCICFLFIFDLVTRLDLGWVTGVKLCHTWSSVFLNFITKILKVFSGASPLGFLQLAINVISNTIDTLITTVAFRPHIG